MNNIDLNPQTTAKIIDFQKLNLNNDLDQIPLPTIIKPHYIDINSQITLSAVTSAESLLNETNKSVKTPISLLQEIMTKCSLPPPVYEEVSTEGHSHEPIFCFRVVIHMKNGDIIAMAKGSSKKRAKHAAAFEVLNQLKIQCTTANPTLANKLDNLLSSLRQICLEDTPNDVLNKKEVSAANFTSFAESLDSDNMNPVGELIELTQRFALRPPEFIFGDEQGPSHDRVFTCEAKLNDLKVHAIGRSKKSAKRTSAMLLLQKIKENPNFHNKILENENGGAIDELSYNCSKMKEKLNGKKTSDSIQQLKLSNRDAVKKLAKTIDLNELNRAFLEKLASEENFSYKFYKVKSSDENQRVFLNIFMNPIMVFFGKGKTLDDAIEDATRSALEAIQIFCSRT